MGLWYPTPLQGLLIMLGSGLFLLTLGLVPLWPGYQQAKHEDPTPMSLYILHSFLGILMIAWGIGHYIGWPAWIGNMLIWIGGGACILAVVPDVVRWFIRLIQR